MEGILCHYEGMLQRILNAQDQLLVEEKKTQQVVWRLGMKLEEVEVKMDATRNEVGAMRNEVGEMRKEVDEMRKEVGNIRNE